MKAGRGLTVERMMELGQVSRASFYRFEESTHPLGNHPKAANDNHLKTGQ